MKKVLLLVMILFLFGCTDSNFYKSSKLDDVEKVADLSNDLYLYEKNVDDENYFKRYYYVGNENELVYRELVTYFSFGNDDFDVNNYTYDFVTANEINENGCTKVGIEAKIFDDEGNIVYHRIEEGDRIYIDYCLKDSKPYKENIVE